MVRVVKSTIIDAPVDRVWAILRDFNGFDRWLPPIKASAIERHLPADLIGCVRRVQLQDGAEVREQLLALSDLEMTYSYCLLDTPIPLFNYVAHVRLLPVTDGNRTFWHWEARFTAPPAAEADMTHLVAELIFQAGFESIRNNYEALAARGIGGADSRNQRQFGS